jgi:hypothetical protein
MMNNDDAVARWEARNAKKLFAEEVQAIEDRRKNRMIAFTRTDLMRATLAEAAYRTAVALGIPPNLCRAALVPDPETKKYKPGIEIDKSVPVDEVALRHVFGFAFRQVSEEWSFDLAYAAHDAQYAPQLAESIPRKEDLAAFGQRVKAWLQPA